MWIALTGFLAVWGPSKWRAWAGDRAWKRRALSILGRAVVGAVPAGACSVNLCGVGYLPTIESAWESISARRNRCPIKNRPRAAVTAMQTGPVRCAPKALVVAVNIQCCGPRSSPIVVRLRFILPPAWFRHQSSHRGCRAVMMIGGEFNTHGRTWLRSRRTRSTAIDALRRRGAPGGKPRRCLFVFGRLRVGGFNIDTECVQRGPRQRPPDHLTKDVIPFPGIKFRRELTRVGLGASQGFSGGPALAPSTWR